MECALSIESKAKDVCHIVNDGRESTALPLCILIFVGGKTAEASGLGWK